MKTFTCQCGQDLFFENTRCNVCGRTLGFVPEELCLHSLEPMRDGQWRRAADDGDTPALFRQCTNYYRENVCNWMVPSTDDHAFCVACRLNEIIPDLSDPRNRYYWYQIELAKRRLVYTLLQMRLEIEPRSERADGVSFAFLADSTADSEFTDPVGDQLRVLTGHENGRITINLAEADDIARTRMQARMNERYRTLLGHLRHEIAHYYWDRLIRDAGRLQEFRAVFGDERMDYGPALERYYNQGARPDWQQYFISAYASAHPWEDWAESWAHLMHMTDTLETGYNYGFVIAGQAVSPPNMAAHVDGTEVISEDTFDELMRDWVRLTIAINAINRSMGQPDAYPFVLSDPAKDKLHYLYRLIGYANRESTATPTS